MSRPPAKPIVSPCEAAVRVEETGGGVVGVALGGVWKVTAEKPDWFPARLTATPTVLRVTLAADLGEWDSSLLLFIHEVRSWAAGAGVACELEALPEGMRSMLAQFTQACEQVRPEDRSKNFVTVVGIAAEDVWDKAREIARFVGECVLSAIFLFKNPHKFRFRDCLDEMQLCGAMALPIVSLISLLIGLIMAYQSAILMRQFGA
ncbi:MAG: ABC transporter permease, partial [Burkholderiales bacterium]|nr:ABC transporter permease [Opitutaceae bacterium]